MNEERGKEIKSELDEIIDGLDKSRTKESVLNVVVDEDESEDDFPLVKNLDSGLKEKLQKITTLKGDEKLKFMAELLPYNERLDFFAVVKSLELDKNEEALSLLYVHTYLRYLYQDIPNAFDIMVQSMDSLTMSFDETLKDSIVSLKSTMKEIVEIRKKELVEVDGNFLKELENNLEAFKIAANVERDSILMEVSKSKDEYKRMVEEVKIKTTRTFVNAIAERFQAYEPNRGSTLGTFFTVAAAVVAGMALYDFLKSFV